MTGVTGTGWKPKEEKRRLVRPVVPRLGVLPRVTFGSSVLLRVVTVKVGPSVFGTSYRRHSPGFTHHGVGVVRYP